VSYRAHALAETWVRRPVSESRLRVARYLDVWKIVACVSITAKKSKKLGGQQLRYLLEREGALDN
jgi:hypothetical protein